MFTLKTTAIVFMVVLLVNFAMPAFGQADHATNISKTAITPLDPDIIYFPGGEIVELTSGYTQTFWRLVVDANGIAHINWLTQINAEGRSLTTGNTYKVIAQTPYSYSGDFFSDNGAYNYSSRAEIMFQGGSAGHVKVSADFHSQFDGENLVVRVSNYRVN